MRGSIAIILIILILLGLGITVYHIYKSTTVKLLPWLSEEIGAKPVLTTYTSTIKPGQVYLTIADKHGWQVKEKETTLYEKLTLENIDLQVNDVIAPHLYDIYLDGQNDYLKVSGFTLDELSEFSMRVGAEFDRRTDRGVGVLEYFFYNSTAGSSQVRFSFFHYGWRDTDGEARTPGGYDQWLWATWTSPVIASGEWHTYYAVSNYAGNSSALYIDGSQVLSKTGVYFADKWGIMGDFKYMQVGTGYISDLFKGRISHVMVWQGSGNPDGETITAKPLLFLDPTFYNGTAYFNLIDSSDTVTVYGGTVRIPSQQTWLWFIKQLKSDNKIHFMYFPVGSIVRVLDSNGNLVREFTIEGIPVNDDGQIEDYAISLDTTTIPGATIVAYVPSMKVRVYGPYGAMAEIMDSDGNVYGKAIVGPDGYADIPLSKPVENGQIIISANSLAENKLNVNVQERSDGSIEVTVLDEKGVLVPNMLVRIADPSGVVVYAATTGQDGKVVYEPDRPLPEITVEVSGVWENTIHYTTQTFKLSASLETATVEESPAESGKVKLLLLGLGVIILIALLIMVKRE